MIVICLEGCHGSGKTRLCLEYQTAGFNVFDEAFMSMPCVNLHPQSFVMENIWVSHWIERLLLKQKELGEAEKNTIFFADRSPFSAIFYSKKNGNLLEPLILEQLKELRESAGIYIYTVYLRVQDDLLWDRIQSRLLLEPHRVQYNEDSREWMKATVDFYERMQHIWDFIFENHHSTIKDLTFSLLNYLLKRVSGFEDGSSNILHLNDPDISSTQNTASICV